MTDDEWVKAATANDFLVVDLLLRLTHSSPTPPPPPSSSYLQLHWCVRQPRSKSIALKPGIARASPTTPLSWSGATSQSGGAGGVGVGGVDVSEESSRPAPGSKVIGTSEATPTKRPRKKKTMTELKEEEVTLLKERKDLKRNISILLVTLKKKRASNESLKRMKMDFTSQRATEGVANVASEETSSNQTMDKLAASSPDPVILPPSVTIDDPAAALPVLPSPNTCSEVQKEITIHENKFVVPDLNVAFEEYITDCLHGGELKNDQE